ncbi:MAG: hypothetical protein H0X30_11010 [Anaerolineae bacterium]|nr:hypothetical protein [Anaerolineae bacterium]
MTNQVHYSCEWLILDYVDFNSIGKMLDVLHELQCDISTRWDAIRLTENGIKAKIVVVTAPSAQVFASLQSKIEKYANLTNAHPVDLSDYDFESLRDLPSTSTGDFIALLNELAEYNQAVQHAKPMWVSALWIVNPLQRQGLEDLLQELAAKDCELFYTTPFRPYEGSPIWMISLFMKLNHVAAFNDISTQLSQIFKVQVWHWIYKHSSIELNVAKLLPLIRETAGDFITLIQTLNN